ncbi:MAG: hypothetical protein IPP44_19545 [Ideonella sp.]|nr:hypothetical protein [Ideonella sp.]
MTEDISNLIVEHLKAIRAELASVKADTVEIKERLRSHDASIIELRRADVHVFEDQARHQVSIDALARRIERIEGRLELI